jgi:hypothetical protein
MATTGLLGSTTRGDKRDKGWSTVRVRRGRSGAVRGGLAVALTVALALPAWGGASPASGAATATSAPARGWVTGRVVDQSGKPVAGDLVDAIGPREVPEAGIIAPRTDRRTWTDADGRFRVRQAAPGYLIQICDPEPSDRTVCRETALGVDHLITYVGPGRTVTDSWVLQTSLFAPQPEVRHLGQVTVKPQSYVHGRLRHASNALVQIERLNGSVAYRAVTDADGDYRISGLAPGHYRMSGGGNGEGWLPWRSHVITLGSGRDVQVDGVLRRGARVHGILTSGGRPVPSVDVLLRRRGGDVVAAATTDSSGRYRLSGQRPGDYRVGILYDGSDYQRHGVSVTLPEPTSSVVRDISVTRGAVITIAVRSGRGPATDLVDELRNAHGRPVAGHTSDSRGHVRYTGLSSGTYHFYGAQGDRFASATIRVHANRTYGLGRLRLTRPTLTMSGTTAPHAVVSATTGDQCPPDGEVRLGAFTVIERANARGHYTLSGLVPGRFMLRSNGWPANYVPRCVSGVSIRSDTHYDLPLDVGSVAAGRLVYATTGTPVITTLSYELHYPHGSPVQPTLEQPARAKALGASGEFRIDALGADTVTGRLSQGADLDQINNNEFLVIFPFQDGTPYYLTSTARTVDIPSAGDVDLGDIPLYLHR